MTQEPQLISLALIRIDEAVWPRHEFDEKRVEEFAELFAAHGPEALPPVVIVHDGAGQFLVCDGHHRIAALYQLGATAVSTVTADLPAGQTPEQFAYEYALRTAAQAAKPLTRAERNGAVDRLLQEQPDWSDRKIADLCGVSHQTVGRRRAALPNGPRDQRQGNSGAFRRAGELESAQRLVRALEKAREARGLGVGDFLAGRDRT